MIIYWQYNTALYNTGWRYFTFLSQMDTKAVSSVGVNFSFSIPSVLQQLPGSLWQDKIISSKTCPSVHKSLSI